MLRRAQVLARVWSQVGTGWWGGQGRGQEVYVFLFLKKDTDLFSCPESYYSLGGLCSMWDLVP